jgi:predicted dehydrogenase
MAAKALRLRTCRFVFQAHAFLEQIAGLDRLPSVPPLADGLYNMRLLEAVVASADADGKNVAVP